MKMKHGGTLVSLLFLAIVNFNAAATIYVDVRGGNSSGLPIAIVPFGVEGADKEIGESLTQVIKSDLENSGQFKPTPFSQLQQFPSSPNAVQYPYWQGLGVEDMVVGRVQKTGSGRYSVNFELLDVVRPKTEGSAAKPLVSMRFDDVKSDEFRALAHHISDMVFEKLIGVKGIFSTRIAYVSVTTGSKGKIYTLEVADSDGYNPKPLYRSSYILMSPAWSNDAKKIAFVSYEKDRQSINVADVSSGRVTKITQFPGINGAPAWSPDGQTLAVVLSKDGSPKLYTVDLAKKKLSRLTDGTSVDTEPRFAPDGRSVVFTSSRGGKPQIYRVSLAGGKVERLTFKGNYNASPSLTPDGKRLIMLHGTENGLYSIAVQSLANGELRELTAGSSSDDSPRLAPNGMMVIFGSEAGGKKVLGAVSLDGRLKIRLPAREGDVQEPAWSPFAS